MNKKTPNPFSLQSELYAQARPRYPVALYEWIAGNTKEHGQAWDCATGNGQAAVGLAPYFKKIQATDLSAEQISQALAAENVEYAVSSAENTAFAKNSFDLVTVAQALHWFDYDKFWAEIYRVCKPGALFCAWGYAWFNCEQPVMEMFVNPLRELVAPYWATNNRILWDGYQNKDIRMPFDRIVPPELSIEEQWDFNQLVNYVKTWSSYKNALLDKATADRLISLFNDAQKSFDGERSVEIKMPLSIVAGYVI